MDSEKKPMNPERLAWLRDSATGDANYDGLVRELLAAHDYHEQRADDAERERDEARAVCTEVAVVLFPSDPHHPADTLARIAADEVVRLRARVRVETRDVERLGVSWDQLERWVDHSGIADQLGLAGETRGTLRDVINSISDIILRPGLDILDEMAAMEVPG